MTDPATYRGARSLMEQYGLSAKKKYGQNFLTDTGILDRIVDGAGITKEDAVLEIGPGLGALTRRLSEAAGEVTAIEVDGGMIPVLTETLGDCPNVRIIHGDILKTPLPFSKPFAVVANLPYYITTPVLFALLESDAPIKSITVMVQKEVADRITASPGTKDYGALTLTVAYRAEPKILFTVPPEAFLPRPKVESAVVHLEIRKEPKVSAADPDLLFRLIRAAFLHRRKTLANCLAAEQIMTKEEAAEALKRAGFSEMVRGEALTLEDYERLTDAI